jgi:hypothetical protein
MEPLEELNNRIEYGRRIDNEPSKIFFSLEPTLRFALINYLNRKHGNDIPDSLIHLSDLEVIKIFDEIAEMGEAVNTQIFELYQAVTDYRLITFSRKNGVNNPIIKAKADNLKSTDYYLNVMENVVTQLLWDLKSRSIAL